MTAFLDVFIPAYGKSMYLSRAIESILDSAQDYKINVTVVDDASPTSEIEEIVKKFSQDVTYLRNEENLGIGKNFELCHSLGKAELTLIMGSDDMFMKNSVIQLRKMYERFPNAVMYQLKPRIIDADDLEIFPLVDRVKSAISPSGKGIFEVDARKMFARLAIGNFTYFPGIAWNNKYKSKIKWETNYKLAIDLDLLFKLCDDSFNKFVFTSLKSFSYRRHDHNYSIQLFDEDIRIKEELQLHAKILNNLSWKFDLFIKLMMALAPAVRIHGIIYGLKKLKVSPKSGVRIIFSAFGAKNF